MAALTVLRFPTADGADTALAGVQQLQQQHALTLRDAAIVSWPAGTAGPTTHRLVDVAAARPLGGAFWGMLFGLIFFTPLFAMVVGLAVGALGGTFGEFGIDENFVCRVRHAITEGTSALFLMTNETVADRVAGGIACVPFEVIATRPSRGQEQRLREAVVHG
jgi:uncharacterized membrane protein